MPEKAVTTGDAFVGPRPYPPDRRLYGRGRELTVVTNQLLSDRFVLLYSPSGAGKSSLLLAKDGVLDRMTEEDFTVLPVGRLHQPPTPGRNRYLASLTDTLGAPGTDLTAVVRPPATTANPDAKVARPTLLVIDQFEELLTLDPTDTAAKREFLTALAAAVEKPGVWLLVAMREDYVPALDPYLHLLPTRLRSRFRLDLLTLPAADRVVRQTLGEFDVTFDGDEANQEKQAGGLLADLARVNVPGPDGRDHAVPGTHVEPVFLQVACQKLWRDTRPRAVITATDLKAQGDVSAALQEYYDAAVREAVAAVPGASERAVRNWVGRELVSDGGVRLPTLGDQDGGPGVPAAVLGELAKRYVLRAETRNNRRWYELAHDRLVEPVRASNAAWRVGRLTQFQHRADLYAAVPVKSRELLAVGPVLSEGEALPADQLTDADRQYLEASRAERHKWRMKAWIGALVAAVGLIALASGVAVFWVIADRVARDKAEDEKANARRNIENLLKLAEEQSPDYPLDAMWMAADALTQADRLDLSDLRDRARNLLVEADARRADRLVSQGAVAATDLVLSADGHHLAVRRADDSFAVVAGSLTAEPTESKLLDGVTQLLAVPNSKSVLTGHADGRVLQWELADPTRKPATLTQIDPKKSPCTALTVSRERAAAGFADGRVALFDTVTRKELCAPWKANTGQLAVNSLVLSPYPIVLLTDSQNGELKSWDLRDKPPRPLSGRNETTKVGATVTRMAVSPNATFLAVGTVGQGVKLFGMNPNDKQLAPNEIELNASTNRGTVTVLAVSKTLPAQSGGQPQSFVLAAFSNQTVGVYTIAGTAQAKETIIKNAAQFSNAANRQYTYRPETPNKDDSDPPNVPDATPELLGLTDVRVTAAAFSDDTSRLIVGTSDGKALVWELAADGLTKPPRVLQVPGNRAAGNFTAVKVTADNKYVLAATAGGTIRRWGLDGFDPTSVEKRKAELRKLSVEELLKKVEADKAIPVI